MNGRHITNVARYRTPYGAAVRGVPVALSIDVWGAPIAGCELRLWQEGVGERYVAMQRDAADAAHFTVEITPDELGVLWYSFRVQLSDGSFVWYGAQQGWTCGEGAVYTCEPPSFQMTVYEPARKPPQWYTHGVVYQIFPDRFARGADWCTRVQASLGTPRKGPERVLVESWDAPPCYKRAENGDIACWGFYGGTLQGITEKLDYLIDLGISVLYLNPIFEAASNHRYDTADYLAIDPMLGTAEDFAALIDAAKQRGISVILDGVFNHSGQDSRYFNAYGNYESVGAAQSEDSPYRSWYHFNADGSYESWWGVRDLPEYNEDSPSLRQYFCGEDGVVRSWLRAGAKGWRLDVADELPDSFIAEIKAAALAEREDALVIGEVWEDASNKYAYGQLRHYFQGAELDGVMNYPLRTTVIEYLTGAIHAPEAARRMQQLAENYPPDALACSLNLLGSHDRERILTMLGDPAPASALTPEERSAYRLSENQRSLAFSRLRLALLLQMTAPGVPSIYYGDEAGLEGFDDPTNRAAMPWGNFDAAIFDAYRSAIALRRNLPVLAEGSFELVAFGNEVLGWWRRGAGEAVCVLINRSPYDAVQVAVPACFEQVTELARAQAAQVADGHVVLQLKPFEASVLYFHPQQRLQKPLEPGQGIIAHLTSVPNAGVPGTLGAPARRFVDWLAERGYTYWQMLPVNPTDEYGSPYAGLSAFAGNPALIEWPGEKEAYLEALAAEAGYEEFCVNQAHWLEPYAAFCAIKAQVGEVPWQLWPARYRAWSAALLDAPELQATAERIKREQYAFNKQWSELRAYAAERHVAIIGDIPMYVSADSADVWANPNLFALDEAGNPSGVAGVPPDAMAAEGQVWGNPTYRWDVMAADGYRWWLRRLERMFALYDYVRIDHFLGFSSYYVVEAGHTALDGAWKYGPGLAFFQKAYEHFGGPLPLIAENLGTITPAVRLLVATCGFAGMDVIQFADTDVRASYEPAPEALIYMSTHDTSTLVGWCEQTYGLDRAAAQTLATSLIERTRAQNSCGVVMMQLQDALHLGDEARMNVPGVASGNWSWHAPESMYN